MSNEYCFSRVGAQQGAKPPCQRASMRTCQVSLLRIVANMIAGTSQPDHADIHVFPTVLVDRGLDSPKPSHKVSLPEPQEQTFPLPLIRCVCFL